jgi:hypothetical protein
MASTGLWVWGKGWWNYSLQISLSKSANILAARPQGIFE